MTHPVFEALLPVVLLIALGYCVGRKGWVGAAATKDLSNLVFLVLAPALLFRTMSGVRVQDIDFRPVLVYFGAMWLVFGAVLWRLGLTRRAAVLGLAATFSNTLMIGVPLVGLAYGQQGLVTLFALVSLHAFVMLTMVTVVLEFAVLAEQQRAAGGSAAAALHWPARLRKLALTVARAGRASLLHPVPLPILCGLLFAQTGLQLPGVIDRPLQLLGAAFGPVALLLVGISLAGTALGGHWRVALGLMLMKNLLHPLVLALLGLALGFAGVPFAVMVLAASLPIGANVYLYAMRYRVAEEEVTAAIAMSTMLGVATVALVMALVPYLP
ncbi:transporter [Vandammella animalimorsus]|uniref:Transporter n=1 Tax=Vandammella animalimorsus TaxID=2029117 RepID=A0A2A2ACZ4_9BURK|nr:AEC family transporter [Vandammella animalimorsus]RRD68264.1 AEC family transporter [Comamonadaceae bacterium OH2310_COT-174]PAT31334.1 transporter [Vandammella animalimorsus]PAT35621.1 transporter [Vandammella animalimorsus]PAX15589.1 transporter [Vandammella animalimorsus]PAX17586.1 transporter [Vandammella animalimorsus]